MSVLALYDSQFSAAQIVAKTGYGQIFIDSADGALKWKDGAGNLSTIGAGVGGTGTATRLAEWQGANTLQDSTLVKSGAGVLTLSAAGAYTLTVPETGTAALLATANVFTANQRVNGLVGINMAPTTNRQLAITPVNTSTEGLDIDMPAGTTATCVILRTNGVAFARIADRSGLRFNSIDTYDNGAGAGPYFNAGRNSNASTPAAGHFALTNLGNTIHYIWPDTSGLLRIGTMQPINAQDTSGTIVGTQSSYEAAKLLDVEKPDLQESLRHVVETASQLYGFRYKNGAYNSQHYPVGIITDFSPRYGQDRDRDHPGGKSLNLPVAIGDLFASIAVIDQRLTRLEEQWARLRLRLAP